MSNMFSQQPDPPLPPELQAVVDEVLARLDAKLDRTKGSMAITRFYKANETLYDRLIMIAVTSLLAWVFHGQISDVKVIADNSNQTVHEVKDVTVKKLVNDFRGKTEDMAAVEETVAKLSPTTEKSK